jgi:hypothetical protein
VRDVGGASEHLVRARMYSAGDAAAEPHRVLISADNRGCRSVALARDPERPLGRLDEVSARRATPELDHEHVPARVLELDPHRDGLSRAHLVGAKSHTTIESFSTT